jgi:hypothetical protein
MGGYIQITSIRAQIFHCFVASDDTNAPKGQINIAGSGAMWVMESKL